MKRKIIIWLSILIVVFVGQHLLSKLDFFKNARTTYDNAYDKFLENDVFGIINKVDYEDHAISITLMDGEFYLCDTYTNSNGDLFQDNAEKGDSLVKYKDNDYFLLKKKNGKEFYFQFMDRTKTNPYYMHKK